MNRTQLITAILAVSTFAPLSQANDPLKLRQHHPTSSRTKDAARVNRAVRDGDRYQFRDITIPGAVASIAVDLNNHGIVSGIFLESNGDTSSFVWEDDQITYWAYPEATWNLLSNVTETGVQFGNLGHAV